MIYLLGCILAFIFLFKKFLDTPSEIRCSNSDVITIFVFGILFSWVTVILFILAFMVKK